MSTDLLTFGDILARARANTVGLKWRETGAGYIRCEDGRCPLEAAAGTEANNLTLAVDALDCSHSTMGRVTAAADYRVGLPHLPSCDRGQMIEALNVQRGSDDEHPDQHRHDTDRHPH